MTGLNLRRAALSAFVGAVAGALSGSGLIHPVVVGAGAILLYGVLVLDEYADTHP